MKFLDSINKHFISEELKYHLDNGLGISESVFRMGSKKYHEFILEVKSLYKKGLIELSEDDEFLVERLKTGTRAVTRDGKSVTLHSPSRNNSNKKKKFIVYVDSGNKNEDGKIIAKKVEWGDPNLDIKNGDEEARKSFLARHKCDEKSDINTAGWWACNVHRFHKQLGLSSSKRW